MSIVWLNMLPADNRRAAIRAAQTMVDSRVRHFHDPQKRAGKIIAQSLGEPDRVAWDIYLFYPPGRAWDDVPPAPSHWVHQVSDRWVNHFHYGDDLTEELRKIAKQLMPEIACITRAGHVKMVPRDQLILRPAAAQYYTARASELLREFDRDAERWRPYIATLFGDALATSVLPQARAEFETLILQIPYIGGDENHLTGSLVEAARCLALYKAMRQSGKTAADTGRSLYAAVLARAKEIVMPMPASQTPTSEELMTRRQQRAARSQERRYAEDYVYEFVPGDGVEFDYGYDFTECATQKFYHAQGADEFLPFFCFLDYPSSRVGGLGLCRTMTLAEGYTQCDHRFKKGRQTELEWPPPFLKNAGARS